MKSSQIKLTLTEVAKYTRKENKFQNKVYSRKINEGKMTPMQANRNYLIISNLGKWCQLLQQKGYTYADFEKIINNLPPQRRVGGTQGRIFENGNSNFK